MEIVKICNVAAMQQSPEAEAVYTSVSKNKKNILLLPLGTTAIPALQQTNYPTIEAINWPDSAYALQMLTVSAMVRFMMQATCRCYTGKPTSRRCVNALLWYLYR